MKLTFISKNLFLIWSLQAKVMNKIQIWCLKMSKKIPCYPSLNFVHNFWLETPNQKQIFGDEIQLDLSTFCSSKFFQKRCFTMPKWGLKSSDFIKHWIVNVYLYFLNFIVQRNPNIVI